jgi:hypothetical protein
MKIIDESRVKTELWLVACNGSSIALMVSRHVPIEASRVQYQVRSYAICGRWNALVGWVSEYIAFPCQFLCHEMHHIHLSHCHRRNVAPILTNKLHGAEPFLRIRQLCRYLKISPNRVHNSLPLVPVLSRINPVHTTQSYLRFILILSTYLRLVLSILDLIILIILANSTSYDVRSIHPIPRSCQPQAQPPQLEDHPLSAVGDWLFNIFAATVRIWRLSPPSSILTTSSNKKLNEIFHRACRKSLRKFWKFLVKWPMQPPRFDLDPSRMLSNLS